MKFAIQFMRRAIQKKAKFDITDLNTIKVVFSTQMSIFFAMIILLVGKVFDW